VADSSDSHTEDRSEAAAPELARQMRMQVERANELERALTAARDEAERHKRRVDAVPASLVAADRDRRAQAPAISPAMESLCDAPSFASAAARAACRSIGVSWRGRGDAFYITTAPRRTVPPSSRQRYWPRIWSSVRRAV
jgi:hypothetical protein